MKKLPKSPPKTRKNFSESKKPLVSIIIRTYNEEKWLGKTLNRLYEQDFQNFEIIIVDSESIDKTLQIAQKFSITKIIKIKKKNYTPGYALNKGIKHASGRFVCILSAHSVPIGKKFLSTGIEPLLKNKKLCGVDGFYTALPDGSLWEKRRHFTYFWGYILGLPDIKTFYSTLDNTHSIIRKSCWEKYHFNELLEECEDYDWAQEMVLRGFKVKRIPRFFCLHSHGLTRNQENARKKGWKKIMKKIDLKKRPQNQ